MLPDDEYYYRGEHDDFDAYVNIEALAENEAEAETDDLRGYKDSEEEFNFDNWEEEIPLYPRFEKKLKRKRLNLIRKADELQNISDMIKRKFELQKIENEEK